MPLKAVYTDTGDLDPSTGVALLKKTGFSVTVLETHNEDEIVAHAHDADAVLLGYAPLRSSALDQLKKIEIISLLSTGYDNLDLEVATSRGICVANIGGTAAEEVATHTMALILNMVRGVSTYQHAASRREWFVTPYPHIPPRLSEHTMGIVGFGKIGRLVARMAAPLFAEIIFFDPLFASGEIVEGFKSATLDEVLANSKVISIHMPLTQTNEKMFSAAQFSKMGQGTYLVNVSRGALINSKDLIDAINKGKISGAALDVLENEPPLPDEALMQVKEISITPHVAYLSDYTLHAYIEVQAKSVIDWFAGKVVDNCINGVKVRK